MRIFSQFHDYYDTAMAQGHDASSVFLRETRLAGPVPDFLSTAKHIGSRPWEYGSLSWQTKDFTFGLVVIAFTGKIWNAVVVHPIGMPDAKDHYFYEMESLAKFMEEHKQDSYFSKRNRWISSSIHDVLVKRFNSIRQGDDSHFHYFVERKAPILVNDKFAAATSDSRYSRGNTQLIENPCLKTYEFFKVMDSYTAFQELDMFIGGYLAAENKPMVPISDADRAYQHGFDKFSFRKEPTKRRR